MSGRGEVPDEQGSTADLQVGQPLFDDDGNEVGVVRGMEEGGVFLSTRDGVESHSIEHARSGQSFGEAYLMWRCMDCGEMGEIDEGIPRRCPNCDASRESLEYWKED
jgi:hypothetical protein